MAKTKGNTIKTMGTANTTERTSSVKKSDDIGKDNVNGLGNGMESGNGNGDGDGDVDNGNGKIRCKSLIIDGTKYRTLLNRKFEERKPWVLPNPKMITSQIPGTIIKIDVKVGQKVAFGEQMLVLEAMKMKNKILFYYPGTVKKIYVSEGDKIPKDFLMVELK